MRSINLIAVLAASATFGVAATADATTYCVASPADCPAGSPAPATVQDALDAADAHDGHDVVRIGAGTFSRAGGFSYWPKNAGENTVEIVGAGNATVLKSATASASSTSHVLLVAGGAPSRVAGLKIVVPDSSDNGSGALGLWVRDGALAEDVAVTDSGKDVKGAGRGILVTDGVVRRAAIAMNDGAAGVQVDQDSSAVVLNSDIDAGYGVTAFQGGDATVRRSRIHVRKTGTVMQGGVMNVESTLIRTDWNGSAALRALGVAGVATTLNASHVTLVGPETATDTSGIRVSTPGSGDAFVNIDNSIVTGFTRGVRRASTDPQAKGEATVVGHSVNYDAANDYSEGLGDTAIDNVTNLAPDFADVAKGDFRISPTSPLIDKGRAASYVSLTPFDVAGGARSVGAKRDLGASEYQALAPVAVFQGAHDVDLEEPLSLDASASYDPDAGDAITSWFWSFGDGGYDEGPKVEHSWWTPGTYEVSLTVKDLTGKTHTVKKQVVVRAPAATVDPGCADCGGWGNEGLRPTEVTKPSGETTKRSTTDASDRGAPVISALKRRGRAVSFSLSEAAKITTRLYKRGRSGRLRPAGPAKTVAGAAGVNKVRIAKLRPGRYRIVVTAIDAAGNRSVKPLGFRVVK